MNKAYQTTVSEIPSLQEFLPEEFHPYPVRELQNRIGKTNIKDRTELDDLLEDYGFLHISGPYPQTYTEIGNEANFQYEVQRTRQGKELQQALLKLRLK